MPYGTAANVNALTGSIFDSTEVTAAIVVADQKIDARLGEITWGTTPDAVKSVSDSYAARVLLSGLKLQKLAEGKVGDFTLPDLNKEEKALLDSLTEDDKVSYYSQDYQ